MAHVSFVQTSFHGGEWSPTYQGRMDLPSYKTGLKVCQNYLPFEEGALGRRPGTRYLAITRAGAAGRLIAFDFSFTQPYQIELTNGFLRLFAGLAQVTTPDTVTIVSISAATPAVVTASVDVAALGWADDDFIKFDFLQSPCTAPELCGREFKIDSVGTTTFELLDPITGAAIDGSTFAYVAGAPADPILKIFELVTPYTAGEWVDIREVTDEETVLLLHGSFQPRVLTPAAPFAIAAQDFLDGPYLDINKTTTTITPSGLSGSITLTASAITGINDNTGFQTTDIGRLVRLQTGPAAWLVGTTYDKLEVVTGSDANIYESVSGGNIGNDPITDDGTNWDLATETIFWGWLEITARASTTSVTATVKGLPLTSIVATAVWRLGLYSATTGWPKVGEYHEGRLWLSGVIGNRVDGSKSNLSFDFSPTDTDGTVADDNAIAAIANAENSNQIFWLLSGDSGLLAGTQAGEWLIRASTLDDPISPTTIQMRRKTKYGCANIEPVIASRTTIFVQRQKRRLMNYANYPFSEGATWYAKNIALSAMHLTGKGIEEIRWQQEPNGVLWSRDASGNLLGCSFKHTPQTVDEPYQAWHPHPLGHGRVVESISTGPSYDGLSTSLYMVTNQEDSGEPDFNIRWTEVLTPVFDDASPDFAAWFNDGGATPCCITLNGTPAAPEGLRIYGLHYLNGKTVCAQIGGFDAGDHVVADGFIDVDFTATFTFEYFSSLTGGSYGIFNMAVTSTRTITITPSNPVQDFLAYVGDPGANYGNDPTGAGGGTKGLLDFVNNKYYGVDKIAGINRLNGVTGSVEDDATAAVIYGVGGKGFHIPVFHPGDGNIYAFETLNNSGVYAKINAATLSVISEFGVNSSSLAQSDSGRIVNNTSQTATPVSISGGTNYVSNVGVRSAFLKNEINLLNVDNMQLVYAADIGHTGARVCRGTSTGSFGSWFVLGLSETNIFYVPTDPFSLYEYRVNPVHSVTPRLIGTYSPVDIDATWTTFEMIISAGPAYDQSDGNLLMWVATQDAGPTNKSYLLKINATTGAIMWQYGFTSTAFLPTSINYSTFNRGNVIGEYAYYRESDDSVYVFDTTTGMLDATIVFNDGFTFKTGQMFDSLTSSITFFGSYTESGVPVPTLIGTYFGVPNTTLPNGDWGRIFLGRSYSATVTDDYDAYGSIGFCYTSRAQLLRPDFGSDAGAQAGPAFAKRRRLHWFGASFNRTQGISFGTEFDKLHPAKLAPDSGTVVLPPTLFSGTISETLDSTYDFEGCIAWEQVRPWPGQINAVSGYIGTQDK